MKKLNTLFIVGIVVFSFISCDTNKPEKKAGHVILIGLDGWTARSIEKADMPNVKQLMQEGSYTLKKRSALPSSSAINWATMFMGSGPELHGFTTWGSKTPEVEPRELSHYGLYPGIWGLMRDQYLESEIGYFYQWGGLQYLAELEAMSTQKNVTVEEGSEIQADQATITEAVQYIKDKKPNLMGIIIDEPDHTGHVYGFDSPEYIEKLKELDGFVGEIVNAVKEAGFFENTIFIVTSDHGGIEKNHGGKTMEEMETAFIVCGKNVKKGYNFTESMMQYDVASTIAYIFNIEQPQVWIGRPVKQIFEE